MDHDINLEDYKYDLPEEKIAKYPLEERADSKMLRYEDGNIAHLQFRDILTQLSGGDHLVFNNTKVIPARIHFHKTTGARIEVFLLEPTSPTTVEKAMEATHHCTWQCLIGNAKRWKIGSEEVIELPSGNLTIRRHTEDEVRFSWAQDQPFSTIIEQLGKVPLPPYIKRESEENDLTRYQTVYSIAAGAVAAPTAGLHFTEEVLEQLKKLGITQSFLTLHVSAGTFQPIKGNIYDHPMHREEVLINKSTLQDLAGKPNICAVGTTSMRTLESLYWYGVMLSSNPQASFHIPKHFPYETPSQLTAQDAFDLVLQYMNRHQLSVIHGTTEIFIFPGYQFRVVRRLITNFHLPGSTLILLVAAFIGQDWEKVYDAALNNNYRFLSYGDCCLLSGSTWD